jgi:uncharacterized protein (DUF433 family)
MILEAKPMPTVTGRITKSPDICGGDACIRGTRIPIWLLVEWRRLGQTDAAILQGYPDLAPADLEAAWEYAAAHPEEIEQAIRDNAEA